MTATTHTVDGPLYWPHPTDFPVDHEVIVTNEVSREVWVFHVILDRSEPAILPRYTWIDYFPEGCNGRGAALDPKKERPADPVMKAYHRWYDMAYTSLAHWKLTGEFLPDNHELLNPLPSFQEPLPL